MKVLSLLSVSHVVVDGLYESIPIVLSFAVLSMGATERDAGMILSLAAVLSTFLGLSASFWSRRFGVLRTIGLVTLFYGLGFAFSAFSLHLYMIGFCFILASSGHNVFHTTSFAYLSAFTESRLRGKIMGDFTAIGDIGRIPLASLAGFIAAYSIAGVPGWRSACFFYGLSALVFTGCLFFSARRLKEKVQEQSPEKGQKRIFPTVSLLKNRQYRLAIQANILDAVGSDHIFTFLPYLLIAKDLDIGSIGGFAFAFTLGCFLGKIACGRLIDRFGTRRIFIYSETMMGLLLVVLILSKGLLVVVVASLFLGIVTKGTVPVMQTILAEPFSERDGYDDVYAISAFSRGVIHMAAPLIFGSIAALYGIHWIYAIMGVAAFLAVVPVFLMKYSVDRLPLRKCHEK